MRLVVADDERYVRAGLLSMIDEVHGTGRVVGEAGSGPELLELCRREQPDVAIVDVKMPGCDGLAAISQMAGWEHKTEWIILTGFAEFEYAKRAVDVGAIGYLLKPVAPEELREMLGRASRLVAKKSSEHRARFSEQIRSLLQDDADIDAERDARVTGGLYLFDCNPEVRELSTRRREFLSGLSRRMEASLGEAPHGAMVTASGHVVAVAELSGPRGGEILQSYRSVVRRSLGNGSADSGAAAQFISFPEKLSLSSLGPTVRGVEEALPARLLFGAGQEIDGEVLMREHRRLSSVSRGVLAKLDALFTAISSGETVTALTYADLLGGESALDALFHVPGATEGIGRALKHSCGIVEPVSGAKSLLSALRARLRGRLREGGAHKERADFLVDATIEYISLNYHRDIGIAEIAEHVDVTPNYLSSVIHRKTGRTFGDHLRGHRLDRARKLLLEEPHSVGTVAAKVGYQDAKHFSKLFQQRFGCTPQTFRRTGCRDAE